MAWGVEEYLSNEKFDCPVYEPTGWFHNSAGNAGGGNGYYFQSQWGISAFCVDGAVRYRMGGNFRYALVAYDCFGSPTFGSAYLPNPQTELGYSVFAMSGSQVEIWRKTSGNYTYEISGNSHPWLSPRRESYMNYAGHQRYSHYSTSASYLIETASLDDIPTSVSLVPDFNPWGQSATISLS